MRYAIAALIAATIYLLRRGRRSWVESGPGAGALPESHFDDRTYDDTEWLREFEQKYHWEAYPTTPSTTTTWRRN